MAQYAGIAALRLPDDVIKEYVTILRSKRDYIIDRLKNVQGVLTPTPQGAFYVLPYVQHFFGKKSVDGVTINDSNEFCTQLLIRYNVALTPGDAFGNDGTVRLSYAASMETLKCAMDGLEKFCNELE